MRIGVGVTTTDTRKNHFNKWMDSYQLFTKPEYNLFVAHNQPTIAAAKNLCLIALEHCDYIFLFDDDCFIANSEWAEYCIDTHLNTGEHHFLYLKDSLHQFYRQEQGIRHYFRCGGCFMFLTKEVIKTVGGFNKGYKKYGFEHAGYSNRIHSAGLTSSNYLMPVDLGNYLFSLDYDGEVAGLKHYPSYIDDMNNIESYIDYNRQVFQDDIKTIYQPL